MSNEKSSSVIGFALIGIILLCFSWYNTRQLDKRQMAEARVRDSLAAVEALNVAESDRSALDAEQAALVADELAAADSTREYGYLYDAAPAEEEFYTLENDRIKFTVSSRGAQPHEVLIKDYYTYDSASLVIVRPDKSLFDLEINADQWVNTSDLDFQMAEQTDTSVTMRLAFAEESYMDAVFTLAPGSYMVGYDLHFVGMDKALDSRTSQMTLKWVLDVPRLEKGYQNERNYSGVAYRYNGGDEVKRIGQRKESGSESFSSSIRWFAFQQQFFSAILLADNGFPAGELVNKFYPENQPDGSLMQSAAQMKLPVDNRNADFTIPMNFFFGPNHFYTMKSYGEKFEKIIPLGGKVIGTISRYIIIPVFNWLNKSIANYGLIILILTLMIKLVISPLTWKSYMSSAKMKVLQPEIQKINEKYPKEADAMKKQQATMELYKKADVNLMGGCFPILLQFPVLWAMFRFFPASIELRQQGFLWCHDLSAYDSILDFGFKVPLYGDHISLFALLMAVTMWGYSKMTLAQNASNQQMPGMNFMQLWLMPIMMLFVCNNLSAGLSYYYMLSNLVTIGQNWAIRKWFVDEDKIYEQIKKKTSSKEPVKKSKFQQRLEAAQKIQQEQMRNQKR